MSDDLVKRLREKRERFHDLSGVYWSEDMLCQEAADRIEALAAWIEKGVNAELRDQQQAMQERIAELEAALRIYSCKDGCNECPEHERDRVNCGWTARATLEGEK